MVAQVLVQRVQMSSRGGAHDAGEADIARPAAAFHLHRARLEIRVVAHHDFHYRLREALLRLAEHLDRKIAGVFDEGVFQFHAVLGCKVGLRHKKHTQPNLRIFPHHVAFEILIQLVQPGEHRTGAARAYRLAVESGDGEHFLGA